MNNDMYSISEIECVLSQIGDRPTVEDRVTNVENMLCVLDTNNRRMADRLKIEMGVIKKQEKLRQQLTDQLNTLKANESLMMRTQLKTELKAELKAELNIETKSNLRRENRDIALANLSPLLCEEKKTKTLLDAGLDAMMFSFLMGSWIKKD